MTADCDWPYEIKSAVNAFESDLEWDVLAAVIDSPQTHDELLQILDTNPDQLDTAVSNLQAGGLVSRRNIGDASNPTAYNVELSEYGARFTNALFDTLGSIDPATDTTTDTNSGKRSPDQERIDDEYIGNASPLARKILDWFGITSARQE